MPLYNCGSTSRTICARLKLRVGPASRTASAICGLLTIVAACLPASSAEPLRTWTWRKHPIEAELVEIKDQVEPEFAEIGAGMVALRRAGQPDTPVFIDALSKADQRYIAERRLAQSGGMPTDVLRMRAWVIWRIHSSPHDVATAETAPRYVPVVVLEANSTATSQATRYGDIQVQNLETDQGAVEYERPYPWGPESPWNPQELITLNRGRFGAQPVSGLQFELGLKMPEPPVRVVRRLRGSFKIVTGEPRQITLPVPPFGRKLTVDDEQLSALGLKVSVDRSGKASADEILSTLRDVLRGFEPMQPVDPRRGAVVRIEGAPDRVYSVEWIDAQGRPEYDLARSGGGASSGDLSIYSFEFAKQIPRDLRLRLTALEDVQEIRVPFDLTDIAVPPAPAAAN